MKIKVCGLKEPENIKGVLKFAPDMVGFILYRKSPRMVEEKKLSKWMDQNEALFGEIKRVGVFVDAKIDYVLNAVHDFKLDFVQLHGTESPEYCREIQDYWNFSSIRRAEFIKAFQVEEAFDFSDTRAYEGLCTYFLFDTKSEVRGGSGHKFDWAVLERYKGLTPFLLSGGIGPEDVEAIGKLAIPQLAGVDINSRFELEPGIKDLNIVETFIQKLRK
ncbi:MAG: phosphoribosylanthranilate isomerase [Saprospiraceae bacterium]|nr:phosphoribosylanthranilate isomerase [Saprospiraceae bacterium]MCB9322207.1 phosphoribosylanthranilate isomerase [Lewinellaceae bacterium]